MAQTLEHQQNVTVTPITLTPFSADVDVIQKLDDEPNDVGGLTAQELKEEFDKNGNAIKTFINGTLIPEVIGADATEQARQEAENERVANEIERVSNENARVTAETKRSVFEEYDATKAYFVGNKVAYLGSSYRCILNTTAGTNPLNTTYWLLIARKGVKGDTGDPGVLSASATVGTNKGTPTVSVSLNQVTRAMAFAFDGIKGEDGAKGDKGDPSDMQKSAYDPTDAVLNAGGIPAYVDSHASNIPIQPTAPTDGSKLWIDTSDGEAGQSSVVTSIGGATGEVAIGNGLQMVNGNLSNAGVTSVNGQSGALTLKEFNPTLLWTNPSPSSAFAEQTITLDTSQYTMLMIEIQNSTVGSTYEYLFFKNIDGFAQSLLTKAGKIITRFIKWESTSEIYFENASIFNTYGTGSQDNTLCIPYKIYGIK